MTTLRLLALLALILGEGRAWGSVADDDSPLEPLPSAPAEVTAAAAVLNRGDTAAAIASLDGFLRQHPNDVGALLLRSVAAEKAADLPGAIIFSGRAIAAQKKALPEVHADPGMMLRHQALFDRLVAENPSPKTEPAAKTTEPSVTATASSPISVVVPKTATGPADSASPPQWASSARASSEYRSTNYSAMQATEAPNVAKHGDNGRAWAAKNADHGEEWIELTFARAVRATGVRVVQSFNPGAVVRIEVIDAAGVATVVWRGPDATAYAKNETGVLGADFPATASLVARVKIVLNEKTIAGWNEIDAVQLVGRVE